MSRSKKKGCNPLFAVLIVGGLLLVALVAALFVGKMMIQNWIQGPGLQKMANQKGAEFLKSDFGINEISWEGKKAVIGNISARGYEDAAFSKFDVNAMRATYAGVPNKTLTFKDVNISQGSIEFSNDRLKGNAPAPSSGETDAPVKAEKLPGWVKGLLPTSVDVGEIVVGSANIEVKDNEGKPTLAIRDTRATVIPDLSSSTFEIKAKDGKLLFAGAPELMIKESSLRWRDSSLFINDAALGVFGSGHISGGGEIGFKDAPATVDLDLQLSQVDIKNVLPPDWVKKITGIARGPVQVRGTTDEMAVTGTLHLDNGVLEGIPVLEVIAKYTNMPRFNRLVLNQAQADFTLRGDLLELRNIQIQSDGLTRVEGVLDKNGEALAGAFQIGVTPGTLRWIPGAEQELFTENRDGFVWTTMNIGGTVSNVENDLTPRIIAVAGARVLEQLPDELQNRLRGILGGLTGTPATDQSNTPGNTGRVGEQIGNIILDQVGKGGGETIEKGKKLLETFGPLLRGR